MDERFAGRTAFEEKQETVRSVLLPAMPKAMLMVSEAFRGAPAGSSLIGYWDAKIENERPELFFGTCPPMCQQEAVKYQLQRVKFTDDLAASGIKHNDIFMIVVGDGAFCYFRIYLWAYSHRGVLPWLGDKDSANLADRLCDFFNGKLAKAEISHNEWGKVVVKEAAGGFLLYH